jgi:SlyX protein
MIEDRLIELEARVAYYEHTLETLNDVVARQQRQIDALLQTCRDIVERLPEAAQTAGTSPLIDERPPHY